MDKVFHTLATLVALCGMAGTAHAQSGSSSPSTQRADRNSSASEQTCPEIGRGARSGGLVSIAPDGTGATARLRDCVVLKGSRGAAQIGRTIEILDDAQGPVSAPGIATADSASYALSLVNVRPGWPATKHVGEADGLSVFVRQGSGDTAAYLANIGVRNGFAATLESFTFSADDGGNPHRAVRTQLGVVNSRDGGEYGLVLQAAEGAALSAGLRLASIGSATWKNYLEAVNPTGETVAFIRGADGAIVGGDILPTEDMRKTIGSPDARYAAAYSQVLQLAEAPLGTLPRCGNGVGAGTLAYASDARRKPIAWGEVVRGGGKVRTFVKCDGDAWTAF